MDEIEDDGCECCGKGGPTEESDGQYVCKQCKADNEGDANKKEGKR